VSYAAEKATITLAQIDQNLVNYIEFYREHPAQVKHPRMTLNGFDSGPGVSSDRIGKRPTEIAGKEADCFSRNR
jgi:hypothetical protein